MARWTVIGIDKDETGKALGATHAMKVPGGMLVRSVSLTGMSMVFIPGKDHVPGADMASTWIEDNKIT